MKKIITLLLVLTGMVCTASADDYLPGSWYVVDDKWPCDETNKFSYVDGVGTLTLSLAAETTYSFKFNNGGTWIGNGGEMTSSNCIGWVFDVDNNAQITTTIAGDYTFIVKWPGSKPFLSVIYPVGSHIIHFEKPENWGSTINIHRWIYQSDNSNSLNLTSWPGIVLSENANNSGYYDYAFTDSYNKIIFNDGTSQTGDLDIDFSYPEYWVTKDGDTKTTAPEGWVGYTRSVTAGNFGTICLPFAATVTGATVFKITGQVKTDSNLSAINLESVDELEAGKAYIFNATGATLTATYSGTYTAASAGYGMMGNLSANAVTVPQDNYVVGTDNKLHKVTGDGVTVGQNKAYITLDEIKVVGARAMNFISFDDEATGINSVNRETVNNNGEYFNLAGQRVAQPTKGLYIVNGKKIVIR